MTNPSFNPDDPRLTAFVLGELADADRAAVERLLESSPAAAAFVDDLRDTIGTLQDELSAEPAAALTSDQRAALRQAAAHRPAATPVRSRRARLAAVTATVAALVVLVAVLPRFERRQLSRSDGFEPGLVAPSAGDDSLIVATDISSADSGPGADSRPDTGFLELSSGRAAEIADVPSGSAVSERMRPVTASEHVSEPAGRSGYVTGRTATSVPREPVARSKRTGRGRRVAAQPADEKLRVTQTDQPAAGNAPEAAGRARSSHALARQVLDRQASGNQASVGQAQARPAIAGRSGGVAGPQRKSAGPSAGGYAPSFTTRLDEPDAVPSSKERRGGAVSAVPVQTAQPARATWDFRGVAPRVVQKSERLPEQAESLMRRQAGLPAPETDGYFLSPDRNGDGFDGAFGRVPVRQRLALIPGGEEYEPIIENRFTVPDPRDPDTRLSTISVDVDTASYANVRRFLMQNRLPPPSAVRIEELVNYFDYDYPPPRDGAPFSVTVDVMLCPWQPGHRLARVGLQARTIDRSQRPPANLVFLIDVSGSMRPANKLPLVQQALRLLVEEMTEDDQIAIVTYASNAGLRLVSTPGSRKPEILRAIDALTAGGSTNGEGGIRLAYDTAIRHYIREGANRVILCTDGDFNVGMQSNRELVELIQEKAASGVFLSVFGFGMGNLKDGRLEKLADRGNGQYGYIDSLQEARRAFQEGLAGTLYTVAKDVKLQVEFNPATVGAYRLIGYENRTLAAADFSDDTKDAGEIGAGHSVTALYELVPRQVVIDRLKSNRFRYPGTLELPAETPALDGFENELGFVRLRYKKPDQETSQPVAEDFPVVDVAVSGKPAARPDAGFQFAAAVASFGMNLRKSPYRGNWDLRRVYDVAVQTRGTDTDGRRAEFIDLVRRALRLTGQPVDAEPDGDGSAARPVELSPSEARIRATVNGRYRRLLHRIEVRDDVQRYGTFRDFGFWDRSTEYKGHTGLLPGYWVYVYPNWYIWAEEDPARAGRDRPKPAPPETPEPSDSGAADAEPSGSEAADSEPARSGKAVSGTTDAGPAGSAENAAGDRRSR